MINNESEKLSEDLHLSPGERSLIEALREDKITNVFYHEKESILGIDHQEGTIEHLALGLDFEYGGEFIIVALNEIKEEQRKQINK